MKDKETVRASKFLSLILRHEPERVGLKLGDAGWVGVDELLQVVNSHGVHLSAETRVTLQVGGRHGKPALLTIRAGDMHRDGFVFRCSANGVWLVDHVPPQFIQFPTT